MNCDANIEKCETDITKTESTRSGQMYAPQVDIIEKAHEMLLLVDVPGATADNIDVQYENGQLTIHANVQQRQTVEDDGYLFREYGVGDYHRSFQIGDGVEADKISAMVMGGVLHLTLPKAEAVRPRKIAVSAE